MRDSFVFYRSFHNALSKLSDADRLAAYDALVEYGLDGLEDADGVSAAILEAFKPLIDANNRRFENGKKGGRPKILSKSQTEDGETFRNTADYKRWRDAVMTKGGNRCAKCGATSGQLNAHHIKNIYDFPELRLDVDNGIILCNTCHAEEHKKENLKITNTEPKPNLNEKCEMRNEKCEKVKDKREGRMTRPTLEELRAFCKDHKLKTDPEAFFAFYESNGWKVGKNPMKDWKAALRTWEKRETARSGTRPARSPSFSDQRSYDYGELESRLLGGGAS